MMNTDDRWERLKETTRELREEMGEDARKSKEESVRYKESFGIVLSEREKEMVDSYTRLSEEQARESEGELEREYLLTGKGKSREEWMKAKVEEGRWRES